jgi:hypothetical protein
MAIGDVNRITAVQPTNAAMQTNEAVYTNPAQNIRIQHQRQQANQTGEAVVQNPVNITANQNPGNQNIVRQRIGTPAANRAVGENRTSEQNRTPNAITQFQQAPTTTTRNIVRQIEENALYNPRRGRTRETVVREERETAMRNAPAEGIRQRGVNRNPVNTVQLTEQTGVNNQPNTGNLAGGRLDIFA